MLKIVKLGSNFHNRVKVFYVGIRYSMPDAWLSGSVVLNLRMS